MPTIARSARKAADRDRPASELVVAAGCTARTLALKSNGATRRPSTHPSITYRAGLRSYCDLLRLHTPEVPGISLPRTSVNKLHGQCAPPLWVASWMLLPNR